MAHPLIEDLSSEIEDVRRDALVQIARLNDPSALPHVERMVADPSPAVQYLARQAVAHLRKLLPPPPPPPPVVAPPPDVPRLVAMLGSLEARHRVQAAMACYEIKDPQLLAALLNALEVEREPRVIATLVKALGTYRDPRVIPILKETLHHSDSRVRANSVDAVMFLDEPDVMEAVVLLASDAANRVRASVALFLATQDPDKVQGLVMEMVESDLVWMKDSAIYVMHVVGAAWCITMLEMLIEREQAYPALVERAGLALRQLRQRQAIAMDPKLRSVEGLRFNPVPDLPPPQSRTPPPPAQEPSRAAEPTASPAAPRESVVPAAVVSTPAVTVEMKAPPVTLASPADRLEGQSGDSTGSSDALSASGLGTGPASRRTTLEKALSTSAPPAGRATTREPVIPQTTGAISRKTLKMGTQGPADPINTGPSVGAKAATFLRQYGMLVVPVVLIVAVVAVIVTSSKPVQTGRPGKTTTVATQVNNPTTEVTLASLLESKDPKSFIGRGVRWTGQVRNAGLSQTQFVVAVENHEFTATFDHPLGDEIRPPSTVKIDGIVQSIAGGEVSVKGVRANAVDTSVADRRQEQLRRERERP